MGTRIIIILLMLNSSFIVFAQSRVSKVEFFEDNLELHRPYKMSLNDISNDVHFFAEVDKGPFIEAVNSFIQTLKKQQPKKRKKFNGDNRILLALIYEDGSPGFISGNTSQFILYDQKVYKDEQYNFLILLNAHFNVPSIKRFLEEKKIIPPTKSDN